MKLITTESQLRSILPNVIKSVEGETSLLSKLTPFLNNAEEWMIENFTSTVTFNTICGYSNDNTIKILTTQIVAYETYRNAIPSLDLVLTPNGFGIVSNSNIAPASKERVERLINSLLNNRDHLLELLIPMLYGASGWKASSQCEFFGSTIFPNISFTKNFASEPNRWDHYLRLRKQLIPVEKWIADNFISPELLAVFRQEVQAQSVSDAHRSVIRLLRAVEIRILKSEDALSAIRFEYDMLTSIVDKIRNDKNSFPEWHASKTAKLYAPTVFVNKKESGGYFF